MALSTLEDSTIKKGIAACKVALEELYILLAPIDVLYNSGGGVGSTVTQAKLDSNASLSGLTKAQLDDAMFALTSTLKGAITTAFSQLEQLAARG